MVEKRERDTDKLQNIPGVRPSLAQDLIDLGYCRIAELRGADPERMYRTLCTFRGVHIDRCVLYVVRCAVYYASNTVQLKWWNWKDSEIAHSLDSVMG